MEVMTRENPRWEEFVKRLYGPEGCNFRRDPDGVIRNDCGLERESGVDRPLARRILEDMDCDVDGSLAYFVEHGGYCDCEILYNVAD